MNPYEPKFIYRDGPSDNPNGFLVVRIMKQSSNRHRFHCEVLKIVKVNGVVPAVGDTIEAHHSNLSLHWEE